MTIANTFNTVCDPKDRDLKLKGSVQNRENYKEKVHERHLFSTTRNLVEWRRIIPVKRNLE